MNTTTTAVENKNLFSSLFNFIQQPESRFTVGLTILLSATLGIIIHYGWQQPFDPAIVFAVVAACVFAVVLATLVKDAGIIAIAIVTIGTGSEINIITNFSVIATGIIIAIISGYFADKLWKTHRKYYLPFLLVLTIVSAWLVFSNQLTETKVGNVDLEMYSKVDEKLAKKSVFIPLFFSTLEDEYFAVEKLTPKKILAKVIIPDNPKAKWRGERKFEDSIYVDLQPMNYAARKKIMGSGIWQIETKTTSEVDMPEAIKVEILKQLNLKPSDVGIKTSDIGS